MKLGSSLRRRRGGGGKKENGKGSRSGRGGRRSGGGDGPRRTFLIVLVIATGGALFGYLFATVLLFPAPGPPSDLQPVPELSGLSLGAAADALQEAGLILGDTAGIPHPRADSGSVLGQSPLAGQLALPGTAVDLTMSVGPERRRVPDVSRLRGDRAVALLEATGFRVEVDSADSPQPRGRILQVVPEPGVRLTLPGAVRLIVSVGPRMVAAPDLLGMELAEARDSLSARGLVVAEVEEVFRFGRDQGRVVEQDPAEGVEVQRGGGVRLVIGRRGGIPQDR